MSLKAILRRDQRVQSRRDGEAVLREIDRRREQTRPCEAPVLAMRRLEQADDTGPAARSPADHGVDERQRLSVVVEKSLRRGGRRCGFPAVVGGELVGPRVMRKKKRAAA